MTEIRLQTIKGKPIFHQAAHGRHSTPATEQKPLSPSALSLPSFAFCPAPLTGLLLSLSRALFFLTICFLFLPLLYVSVPPPFLDLNLPPFLFILAPLLAFFTTLFPLNFSVVYHASPHSLSSSSSLPSLALLSPEVLIPPFSCPSFLLSFFLPPSLCQFF